MTALKLLSLGAGVQSTTLALMTADGTLDRVDGAIFADTKWEPERVYTHLERLRVEVLEPAGIPLHIVSAGDLRNDALNPVHRYASIPYHIRNPDGTAGIGRRQCTKEYKLAPIGKKVRELLGAEPPKYQRVKKGNHADTWIGFSTDEVGRVGAGERNVRYMSRRYPLLDLGMSRDDCNRWMRARGWTSVAKSACIGCPYAGNAWWRDLRDNHPDEWANVVEFDTAIRKGGARGTPLIGEAFLHRSLLPLTVAPIDRVTQHEWRGRQTSIIDAVADLDVEEFGDPDGCSPYSCRSGVPA